MAIDPTPKYNKNLHPVEEWNIWYTKNEAEIKRMPKYNSEVDNFEALHENLLDEVLADDTGCGSGVPDALDMLQLMRCVGSFEYEDSFGKNTTWSPLLTSFERVELDLQVNLFNEDNKGIRDLRPRPPSEYIKKKSDDYHTGTTFTNNPSATENNEVNNIQAPHRPSSTTQSSGPHKQETVDQKIKNRIKRARVL